MNYRVVCVCAIVALAVAMASAQSKSTLSGKCSKPDVQQSPSRRATSRAMPSC